LQQVSNAAQHFAACPSLLHAQHIHFSRSTFTFRAAHSLFAQHIHFHHFGESPMGIFNSLTHTIGNGGKVGNYGKHSLDTGNLMSRPQNGITPDEPGRLQNIAIPKIDQRPRMYSMSEADRLHQAASMAEAGAEQAKRAYDALSKIAAAAAKTQVAHRRHAAKVADATLNMVAANAALGQHLHAQRPIYAQMGHSTDRAAETAQLRVDQVAMKYRGIGGR
jgi:hypothetical protein